MPGSAFNLAKDFIEAPYLLIFKYLKTI
jgi:hypothetical protein